MSSDGWYNRPGVRVFEGKWQDFLGEDAQESDIWNLGGFDAIYIDTFSENYVDLKAFFEHVPDLLAGPESRFGFFNGLGATSEDLPLLRSLH